MLKENSFTTIFISIFRRKDVFYTISIESSDSYEVDCVAAIVYFQFHSIYHTSQSCSKGRLRTQQIDREWCLQIAIENRAQHAKHPVAMIRAFERLCVAASYFRHRFPVICARPAGGSVRYRARPSVQQRAVQSIQAGEGRFVPQESTSAPPLISLKQEEGFIWASVRSLWERIRTSLLYLSRLCPSLAKPTPSSHLERFRLVRQAQWLPYPER
jgi:hypothetical protein